MVAMRNSPLLDHLTEHEMSSVSADGMGKSRSSNTPHSDRSYISYTRQFSASIVLQGPLQEDRSLGGLTQTRIAVAACAYEAQRPASEAKCTPRCRACLFAIVFGVQAMFTLGLVATARAGPCTKEIEAAQIKVDTVLEATAGAGPTLPESQSAGLHHEPTPQSIARAEAEAGEGAQGEQAVWALARARTADEAGDTHLCHAALIDAQRAIAR